MQDTTWPSETPVILVEWRDGLVEIYAPPLFPHEVEALLPLLATAAAQTKEPWK